MLAAVAVGAGPEVSGTCSRLSSVSSSADGVIASSGSTMGAGSIGVFSTGSTATGSATGSSVSVGGSSIVSAAWIGSTEFSNSSGAVLGAGANILDKL